MASKCRPGYGLAAPRASGLISMRAPIVDDEAQTVSYIFPNPFQILGVAIPQDNPGLIIGGNPPLVYNVWDWDLTSEQNTWNLNVCAALFISFMYANRETDNPEFNIIGEPAPFGGITYTEIRAFGRFYGYMMNYLNHKLFDLNFNTFVEPLLEIYKYWLNLQAAAVGDGFFNPQNFIKDPIKMLVNKMFESGSDKRLWGVPGKYTINTDVSQNVPTAGLTLTQQNLACSYQTIWEIGNVPQIEQAFIWEINSSNVADIAYPSNPPAVGDNILWGSPTIAQPNKPASSSLADIRAWIIERMTTITGLPPGLLDAGTDGFYQVDILPGNKIGITVNNDGDGCLGSQTNWPNFGGNVGTTKNAVFIAFNFNSNPATDGINSYFDTKEYYPHLITAEFYLPD